MAKEKNLTTVTSVAAADLARVVTSAGASVKATFANVAKYIVETYNGSTVAGSAQSVKSALDSLNSKTAGSITCAISDTPISYRKSGGWVQLLFDGAINTAITAGAYTTLGTIPSGMLPSGFSVTDALTSRVDNRVMVEVQTSGTIRCYNYGSALASGTNFRFSITYML